MNREFVLSEKFQQQIWAALEALNFRRGETRRLAECILQLSDFFIHSPDAATPWKDKWAQAAYAAYFLPLNFFRLSAAVHEGQAQDFFKGLQFALDFGAGPGTAALALSDVLPKENIISIEASSQATDLSEYFGERPFKKSFDRALLSQPKKTLAVFSYSLTEILSLPSWALECEALMILEPSTQQDGRKLQELRGNLIAAGYTAWAPCTHQQGCPLLLHSKKDWCHDRIHFRAPDWFLEIEKDLPMKNKSLTFSYLLMRKTPPSPRAPVGRLVGDSLVEKGKTRQMFCRGESREFLAWLHKLGPAPELSRGDLFRLPENYLEVSNEIRLQKPKDS